MRRFNGEKLKMHKSRRKEWTIKGIKVMLGCSTQKELDNLFIDVERCISNSENLASLPYRKYDIIKIISLFFKESGFNYIENLIEQLAKKGEFRKMKFVYALLNNGKSFDWQSIMKDTDLMKYLECHNYLVTKFKLEILDIKGHLIDYKPFIDIMDNLSPRKIFKICYSQHSELFVDYIQHFCRECTNNLEVVCAGTIIRKMFGRKYCVLHEEKENGDLTDAGEIYHLFHNIVNKEYEYQSEYLIKTNKSRMNLGSDNWTLFYLKGVILHYKSLFFSDICSPTLKLELKLWFKEDKLNNCSDFTGANSYISLLIESLNYLVRRNKNIRHFADIKLVDVVDLHKYLEKDVKTSKGIPLAPATVFHVICTFRRVIEFLIDYVGITEKKSNIFYPVPHQNPFYDIEFKNLKNMKEPTEIIPDEVMDQISLHVNELSIPHQRAFVIYNDTGLRASEVFDLEYDCINEENNEFWYVPHKVVTARRKKAYTDKKMLVISDYAKSVIKTQIDDTIQVRERLNVPYIFIKDSKAISRTKIRPNGFKTAINRLIKKHDIRDLNNNLWEFDIRQMRKTLAKTMIINKATPFELQYQLGHECIQTGQEYYAEVERKVLAEMNTEFYRKEFEVTVGSENLEKFTEEERRALYVDFRASYRDVEFGKCTRHYSEKTCNKISGHASCALCPKCATGKKYLPKWLQLRDSQRKFIDIMEKGYLSENITNYNSFVEYKREVYFLKHFEDIVEKLMKE